LHIAKRRVDLLPPPEAFDRDQARFPACVLPSIACRIHDRQWHATLKSGAGKGPQTSLEYNMENDLDEDRLALGLTSIDQAHRVLLDALTDLTQASDLAFARNYPSLVAAIERDFDAEETLMDKAGLASFKPHLEQHARMLSALHHAASHVLEGDIAPGREAVVLLGQWLVFHISTMDKALADALR
jgi:hemerythrin